MSSKKKCEGLTKAGNNCTKNALKNGLYCYFHNKNNNKDTPGNKKTKSKMAPETSNRSNKKRKTSGKKTANFDTINKIDLNTEKLTETENTELLLKETEEAIKSVVCIFIFLFLIITIILHF